MNNIRKIKQDLRAYAKRCKDVHYTESLLITFLITGMLFMAGNLFSASSDASIENQRQAISDSIKTINQQVKTARRENDKLLKNTTLELIQLMEQGDHVIKSPWSSWQYGENFFNNNWNGTYKGRGDKQAKYPYEGVFQRSLDVYERAVSPDSDKYGLLSRNRRPNFASGSAAGYGIASVKPVKEPIIPFEVNAGIRPRSINKSAIRIADKTAVTPTLPEAISFTPPKPVIGLPEPPDLPAPPTFNIKLGSYCNHMTSSTSCALPTYYTDGGAFNAANQALARSVMNGTISGPLTDGSPSLRVSWDGVGTMNSSIPLNSYFDSNSSYSLTTNLTISSINPVIGSSENPTVMAHTYNQKPFLVGGSRIATLDNASNGSILRNQARISLIGPLTLGFEVQSDTLGAGTRGLANENIITDEDEPSSVALNNIFNVYGSTISLVGDNAIDVKRENGYTGYKVGLIMTFENDDSAASANKYELTNTGTIKFNGRNSIGIQIYAPGSPSRVNVANNGTGIITIGGIESYGMKWSSAVNANSTMINDTNATINVSGDAGVDSDNKPLNSLSSGMAVIEGTGIIRAYQGKVENKGTINVSGGKGNTGMVLIVKADDDITNSGTINVNSTEKRQNIAMRVQQGNIATGVANEKPKAINKGTINLDGDSSIGVFGKNADVENQATKTIGTTSGKTIINGIGMATLGGNLVNAGTINLEGTGVSSNTGVFMTKEIGNPSGTLASTSNITVKGTNSTGVLVTNGTLNYGGSTAAEGDGVTGLIIGDNGSNTAAVTAASSGTVTVNGGNAATSAGVYENVTTKVKKGSYGIVVGKGSSLVSSGSNNVNVVANWSVPQNLDYF